MKLLDKNYWLHLLDVILKKPQAERGFIEREPQVGVEEVHHKGKSTTYLGARKEVLNPERNYTPFRPIGESQNQDDKGERADDKMDCVTESATNQLEIIVLFLNDLVLKGKATEERQEIVKVFKHFEILYQLPDGSWNADIAQRALAKLSGTTRRGNSQQNVADAVHNFGLVAEKYYPRVKGWNEYYQTVPQDILDRGKKILEYISITHEWANSSIAEDSLKYSPLQTGVFAWANKDANGAYTRNNYQRNHATVRDSVDTYWNIFDSYEPYAKKATRDFNFGWDKIYTISLKKKLESFDTTMIQEWKSRGWELVIRSEKEKGGKGQVYRLEDDKLVELSENDKITKAVKTLAEYGKLEGISELNYLKVTNQA